MAARAQGNGKESPRKVGTSWNTKKRNETVTIAVPKKREKWEKERLSGSD